MHLARGTTAGPTAAPAPFGSAITLSASTYHSEGTPSMAPQHSTDAYSRDVAIRRGGGLPLGLTKLRPFATAGAALLGAGLVIFTPPSLGHVPDIGTFRDVALTSGEDTLPDIAAPWIDQFNTASAELHDAAQHLLRRPSSRAAAVDRQRLRLPAGLLQRPDEQHRRQHQPGDAGEPRGGLTGYTLQNATADTTDTVLEHTASIGNHAFVFIIRSDLLAAQHPSADVTPILDFLASPDERHHHG